MTEQFPASEEGRREKARVNRDMFDRVAERYDLLNRLISLGTDARWRRRLVDLCAVDETCRCLDLCCGTGDVARELAARNAEAVGLDASRNMLAVARRRPLPAICWVQGDALHLPFAGGTFDAVTIAFGNRNVASLELLYREMRRVARPGGRLVSLEICRPAHPVLHLPFRIFFSFAPPLLASLAGADPGAYRYLPESVWQYPLPSRVAEIMTVAGLRDVGYELHMGGAVAIHFGLA